MHRLLLITLLVFATQASAYKYSTFQFSTLPSSPAANGNAGIFLSPETSDPIAALSNPGLLGVMATTNKVSATFYPNRTPWLPRYHYYGFDWTYSARGAFVSWPQGKDGHESAWLPIGISYTEQYFDLGDTRYTDPSGNPIGDPYHSYEYSKNLHFGVSTQSNLWRFGAGTGVRYMFARYGNWVENHWKNRDLSGTGVDLGLWLDNNGVESANRLFNWKIPDDVFIRPAVGLAVTHIGPSVSYDENSRKYPIARTARMTMAVACGIQVDHPKGGKWQLLTLSAASEADDELAWENSAGDVFYDLPQERINPITNVLLGQSSDDLMQKKAFDFSFLEIVTIRKGFYTENGYSNTAYSYETSGWSLCLKGILRLASTAIESDWFESFARHVDVQYAESEESFPRDPYWGESARDGTTYKGVTVRWMR